MAKGGRKSKKSKRKKAPPPPPREDENKISKSLIFANGKVSRSIKQLIQDFRLVMMPHTAVNLQERQKNTIKDFASVSGQLGVTHFVSFTTTERTSYMKVVRTPRGPTLTFRLHEFSLMSDIAHLLKNPHSPGLEYKAPPLVVLNNFNGEDQHIKLMAVMFQNLFPAINLATVNVIDCRRVVLFDYDKETKKIQIRHFIISVKPVGISKSVKQIVVSKEKVPSLGEYEDIAEFIAKGSGASESDIEDAEEGKVILPEKHAGRLNLKQKQSAVRLTELGPRMTIQLMKIEEEFYSGDVIYHELIQKSPEEAQALKEYHDQKKKEKERRKKTQEENVRRKQGEDDDDDGGEGDNEGSDMDDADYYRQEVGEEPEANLFSARDKEDKQPRAKFNPLYKRKPKKSDSTNGDNKSGDNKKRKRDDGATTTTKKSGKDAKKTRSDDWTPTQIPAKRMRPMPKLKKKKKTDDSREDRDEKKANRFDSKGGKGGKKSFGGGKPKGRVGGAKGKGGSGKSFKGGRGGKGK